MSLSSRLFALALTLARPHSASAACPYLDGSNALRSPKHPLPTALKHLDPEADCATVASLLELESAPPGHNRRLSPEQHTVTPRNHSLLHERALSMDLLSADPPSWAAATLTAVGSCASPIPLYASNFVTGTYQITSSGCYKLMEDVSMAPSCAERLACPACEETEHMMPPKGSTTYPIENGFWLGFFAAISIAAENVVIDLNLKTIGMSPEFLLRQRFFSVIELAAKPFLAEVGPPQFSASSSALNPAKNVIIFNGGLGLSSHHGMHGNENEKIWVHRVTVRDFEVGGLHFNGGKDVTVSASTIGPSLGAEKYLGIDANAPVTPALATLSQAILLLRIAEDAHFESDAAFVALRTAVEDFITKRVAGHGIPTNSDAYLFADASDGFDDLPDGSAMYGILFHRSGPAIQEFGACTNSQYQKAEGKNLGGIVIKNTEIKQLVLKSDEVIVTKVNGKTILGPAGDVVQLARLKDGSGNAQLSVLGRAQLKLAEYRAVDEARCPSGDITATGEAFAMYGSTNIPASIRNWMNGAGTFANAVQPIATFHCNFDAMTHVAKGAVGVRVEFVEDVTMTDVTISKVSDVGSSSSMRSLCPASETYKGADAIGISAAFVGSLSVTRVTVSDVSTPNGNAYQVFASKDKDAASSPLTGPSASSLHTTVIATPAFDTAPPSTPNPNPPTCTGKCDEHNGQCPPHISVRYPGNFRCFQHVWHGLSCNIDPANDPHPHQRGDTNICECTKKTEVFTPCVGSTTCPAWAPTRYPGNNRCFEYVWGGKSCNVDPANDPLPWQIHDARCNCNPDAVPLY